MSEDLDCLDESELMFGDCYFSWQNGPFQNPPYECAHCGPKFLEDAFYLQYTPCTISYRFPGDPRDNERAICGDSPGSLGVVTNVGFPLRFKPDVADNWDAFGRSLSAEFGPFIYVGSGEADPGRGTMRYLSKNVTLQYYPCQPYYMSLPNPHVLNRTFMCRIIHVGGSPERHRLLCVDVLDDPTLVWRTWPDPPLPGPIPEQRYWRDLPMTLNTRNEPMYLLLTSDPRASCYLVRDAYCFSDAEACLDEIANEDRIWTCIGPEVGAVNTLWVDYACRHSESQYKYPNANPKDVALRNLIFQNHARVAPLTLTHDSNQLYNSHHLNEWTNSGWDPAASEDDRIVRRPAIGGDYYPVTIVHMQTRARIPARLQLLNQVTYAYFSILIYPSARPTQPNQANKVARLTGTIRVEVSLRVMLYDKSYKAAWEFNGRPAWRFLNPSDPYDLRVARASAPGVDATAQAGLFLYHGPDGEHINLRQTWIGMHAPVPYGRTEYTPYVPGSPEVGACPYGMLSQSTPGWHNKTGWNTEVQDLPEWEMRYLGDVTTIVP